MCSASGWAAAPPEPKRCLAAVVRCDRVLLELAEIVVVEVRRLPSEDACKFSAEGSCFRSLLAVISVLLCARMCKLLETVSRLPACEQKT
jgi:hypothetical protein